MTDRLDVRPDTPRFVEYPLGPWATGWRIAADILATIAITSVVAFFMALLPLVGVVDEHALGPRNHDALDHWSRVWVGLDFFGGAIGVGLLALLATTAANVAEHRRLRAAATTPEAMTAVPLGAQRARLTNDPLRPLDQTCMGMGVFFGVTAVIALITVIVVVAQGDGESAKYGWGLLAGCVVLAVIGLQGHRLIARRPERHDGWPGRAVQAATDAARTTRAGQTRAPRTGLERAHRVLAGPAAKAFTGLVVAWALAGFVMVFIRKPGKYAAVNHFSEPVEGGIEMIWRVLVIIGLILFVVGVLGWLVGLALDAARLLGLARRARAGDTSTRPGQSTLRDLLAPPGIAGRIALALVAAAVLVGSAAAAMRLSGRGPLDIADTTLLIAVAALVLAVAMSIVAVTGERRVRAVVRTAWPITEPLPAEGADEEHPTPTDSGGARPIS